MISTHILDTSRGVAAAQVKVELHKRQGDSWNLLAAGTTNADGRSAFDIPKETGVYRLTFFIEDYFQGKESFFMNTPVIFKVMDTDRKYHVPLLLNPYGFSTYRGT